jgi:hypothetical protein
VKLLPQHVEPAGRARFPARQGAGKLTCVGDIAKSNSNAPRIYAVWPMHECRQVGATAQRVIGRTRCGLRGCAGERRVATPAISVGVGAQERAEAGYAL